jgi:hypothetical protein
MDPDSTLENTGVRTAIDARRGGDPPHRACGLRFRGNLLRCAQFEDRKARYNADGGSRPTYGGENHK